MSSVLSPAVVRPCGTFSTRTGWRSSRLAVFADGDRRKVQVEFNLPKKVKFGMSPYIIGGHEALGDWRKAKAPAMEWSEGDVWQSTLEAEPGQKLEYKYVIRSEDGQYEKWQDGKNLVVHVDDDALKVTVADSWEPDERARQLHVERSPWAGEVARAEEEEPLPAMAPPTPLAAPATHPAADATSVSMTFNLKKDLKFGTVLRITGGCDSLGNWNLDNALTLEWTEGNVWAGEARIPKGEEVEYKYVVTNSDGRGQGMWQDGGNLVTPVEAYATAYLVTDVWDTSKGRRDVEVLATGPVAPVSPEAEALLEEIIAETEFDVFDVITPSGKIITNMTVKELKDECRELGLRPVGRKKELRERLSEFLLSEDPVA